jgi:uncharacterized protein (TIGR02391 family)
VRAYCWIEFRIMTQFAPFDQTILRTLCECLADTADGLTGSEIGKLLSDCGIEDPLPDYTKRDRLFEALAQQQRKDNSANNVVAFIYKAMNPVRYSREPYKFEERRYQLNRTLAFAGYTLGQDGKLQLVTAARTLSEAQERAGRLYRELLNRRAHADVLRFCREELLHDNYFHAVFEASKSIADKIRSKSDLTTDGSRLVDDAFGGNMPLLAFNTLRTETERSEHNGLMNLLKGLFSYFRNTVAHEPKIKWTIDEQDAIDMLTFTSLLHRRLDNCVRTR